MMTLEQNRLVNTVIRSDARRHFALGAVFVDVRARTENQVPVAECKRLVKIE